MRRAPGAAVAALLAGLAAAAAAGEEGARGLYFEGDVTVVAAANLPPHPHYNFVWLESPVWSEEGQFLLFSDVKWEDAAGHTTGMIWKYDAVSGEITEFLPGAGIAGPGSPPADLVKYAEAGPNGMVWSTTGYPTLLVCQHGMGRIVSFSVDDVVDGGIAADKVTVVADEWNGTRLNSPNDVTIAGDALLFSDPPFGLQFRGDTSLDQSYDRAPQPHANVYAIEPPFNGDSAPRPVLMDVWRPNGLAVPSSGKLFLAHTDLDGPHYSVYDTVDGDVMQIVESSRKVFNMTHGIDPEVTADQPLLIDGMTAHGAVVFCAGPGGVYVLDGTSGKEVAFVRIDTLVSNVEVGGGYLWITAGSMLLRLKLLAAQDASAELRGGPWGYFDIVVLLLPIVFLVWAVVKPNPMQSTVSLPLSAVMMFFIKLVYLGSHPHDISGNVITGVLQALTPVSIVAGAIFLFDCMESSGCLAWMRTTMKTVTKGHPVAEVMLIGWGFHFLVEGASGFGTPAALAAPMLYSMGHGKLDAVVSLLLFNGFSATFGAVGTPMWFGIGEATGIDKAEQVKVGTIAAVMLLACSLILVPLVVRILVPWREVKRNALYIYLSVLSIMIPVLGVSFFTVEFPTIVGGLVGLAVTGTLTVFNVGLRTPPSRDKGDSSDESSDDEDDDAEVEQGEDATEQGEDATIRLDAGQIETLTMQGSAMNIIPREVSSALARPVSERNAVIQVESMQHRRTLSGKGGGDEGPLALVALGRTSPLWLTVLILVLTRIEPIGLKGLLTATAPAVTLGLRQLGDFTLSASLVVGLHDIMRAPTNKNWEFAMLYVPSIIPFFLVGFFTLLLYRKELQTGPCSILGGVFARMQKPLVALTGALILVELLRGKDAYADAPAKIIGVRVSSLLSYGFLVLSAALGSLGAFFSGSTTISNLTFGQVQMVAAENLGVSKYAMLALQGVGAAIGNAVCLSNIISACTVIGLQVPEGDVLKKVFPLVAAFCAISTVVCIPFLFLG